MPTHTTTNAREDRSRIGAGWRALRRHLRYTRHDLRKLIWIAKRIWQIAQRGDLPGVLQRHLVVEDIYQGYGEWITRRERLSESRAAMIAQEAAGWPSEPTFSILMPVYQPPSAFFREAVQSIRAQRYARWQLCLVDDGSQDRRHIEDMRMWSREEPRIVVAEREANGGIAAATNAALACATGDYCVFLDQDDMLAPYALLQFAQCLVEHPQTQMVYADEDYIDASGHRTRPIFKPDWDPEWLLSTNYVLHPVAVQTALLRRIGGLRPNLDGAQDWDLLLRIAAEAPVDTIKHVPEILYHWRVHAGSTAAGINEKSGIVAAQKRVLEDTFARRNQDATIELTLGGWRIRHALPSPMPLASLVIPVRDRPDLLAMCTKGLGERTDYPNWQAIVVDNGTIDKEALALLERLRNDPRFKVIRDDRPFNYAALCNAGAAAADGEILVLLNNDVDPIKTDWLTELVTQARQPEIGIVGAALYYPDDTIQHMGVVLGLNGIADRPYIGYPRGFRGVDSRLGSVHTVTAMITACAALRRDVYAQVGGMDESLPIACNDLDLCLRIEDLGLRNILTPFAELYHHESASRGYHYDTPQSRQETADEARFRQKWVARLDHDPMYNRNLSRRGLAYSLADLE